MRPNEELAFTFCRNFWGSSIEDGFEWGKNGVGGPLRLIHTVLCDEDLLPETQVPVSDLKSWACLRTSVHFSLLIHRAGMSL